MMWLNSGRYRLYSSPGRSGGVVCLDCDPDRNGYILTDSLLMILRWISAHDARYHTEAPPVAQETTVHGFDINRAYIAADQLPRRLPPAPPTAVRPAIPQQRQAGTLYGGPRRPTVVYNPEREPDEYQTLRPDVDGHAVGDRNRVRPA